MPRKAYTGRLAFDPDTGFHVDPEGQPVVTLDGGKTWEYAEADDESHFDRYHQAFATVDTTANRLMELQLEHGRDAAEELMKEESPHHYEPPVDEAPAGLSADKHAPTETSHTEAWKSNE